MALPNAPSSAKARVPPGLRGWMRCQSCSLEAAERVELRLGIVVEGLG
jgi:hypothetical protein